MRVAKLARAAWAAAACLFVLGGARAHASVIPGASERVLALVNQERATAGLAPLTMDSQLNTAAQNYSEYMGSANFYAHNGPDGSTPLSRMNAAGFPGTGTWGENIAAAYSDPEAVMQAWMNSPGHRSNILNPSFTHIGIGAAFVSGSQWRYYWTQEFGVRKGGAGAGGQVGGPVPQPQPQPQVQTPSLTQAEPNRGAPGDTVALIGQRFGTTAGAVSFSGTSARVVSWTDTRVQVQVPSGASSGAVYVQNSRGTSNGVQFTIASTVPAPAPVPQPTAPQASYAYPASGNPGTRVTIYGRGFGATTGQVLFNGVPGQIVYWYDTLIGVNIPAGATSGPVQVRTAAGQGASLNFTVLAGDAAATQPQLVYCSPASGAAGTQVSVIGRNLGNTAGTVSFNGVAASVVNWTSTAVVVIVPQGATTGAVTVQTGGATSNGVPFTVQTVVTQPPGGSSTPSVPRWFGSNRNSSVPTAPVPAPAPAPAPSPTTPPSGNTGQAAGTPAVNTGLPTATALSPSVAAPGSTVAVRGSNFGTARGWVRIGRQYARVLSWSDTQVAFEVPLNVGTTGQIVVRVIRPDVKYTWPLYLTLTR